MTLLHGSSSSEVAAGVERCWALVADVERWTEWTGGLQEVTVLQRDEQGRVSVCETVNDARVKTVRVRVAITYDPPTRLSFTRLESGDVRAMDGEWRLEALSPERTRATFDLALDPGPVGRLARPLERALRPLIVGGRADELARAVAARG